MTPPTSAPFSAVAEGRCDDGHAPYTLHRGTTPLVVSIPHCGTAIPGALQSAYVPRALAAEDTDWHVDRLYAFARTLGASLIHAHWSRYVVDLNRPPENTPLYPGSNNTELCPTRFFTGDALYREGCAPDAAEVERRIAAYWRPYHDALSAELARLKAQYGHAVLFDAHSIRSHVPWLFEGQLPALNLGTADGTSCDASLRQRLTRALAAQADYSHVVDGRFKGGYITRHYGQPQQRVHAVQLEMCWHCYMTEPDEAGGSAGPPWPYDAERAGRVQPLLETLLRRAIDWRPDPA